MGNWTFLAIVALRMVKRKTRRPAQFNVIVTPFAATIVVDVRDELKTIEFITIELLFQFAYAIVYRRIHL